MSVRVSHAINLFGGGFNCAQAVLSSFSTDFGLDIIDALRVSGMFGSGMGQMGSVCGAVTGAFMVIGLKYSKTRTGEDPQKMEGYALVRKFTERFIELHGTINCRNLIGVDLNTPEGIAVARENKLFETHCVNFVGDAVKILEEIIPG
jgi:C_GCAxxG_C_C family probable redox protein